MIVVGSLKAWDSMEICEIWLRVCSGIERVVGHLVVGLDVHPCALKAAMLSNACAIFRPILVRLLHLWHVLRLTVR